MNHGRTFAETMLLLLEYLPSGECATVAHSRKVPRYGFIQIVVRRKVKFRSSQANSPAR